MLRKLCPFLILCFSLSATANEVEAQALIKLGEGIRQNSTLYTFDSYKMTHYAASDKKELNSRVLRTLNLTMLADWGTFFTKYKMVEALGQGLEANTTSAELRRLGPEIDRFKNAMLALPINNGSQLNFRHIPGTGLEIQMKGPTGFATVFTSTDQSFSIGIFSIWLGKAHPDANNRASLERLIQDLWKNAKA